MQCASCWHSWAALLAKTRCTLPDLRNIQITTFMKNFATPLAACKQPSLSCAVPSSSWIPRNTILSRAINLFHFFLHTCSLKHTGTMLKRNCTPGFWNSLPALTRLWTWEWMNGSRLLLLLLLLKHDGTTQRRKLCLSTCWKKRRASSSPNRPFSTM